tara:strand:+ start:1356 stop:1754 length:399 start_codon:yes stop_codon:yes gene_type:complete
MAIINAPTTIEKKVTYNTPSQIDIDTANVTDAALGWSPNIHYVYALLQNTGSTNLFLRYGSSAATTTVYHTKLTPGTQVDLSTTVGSSINLISDVANGIAVLTLAGPQTVGASAAGAVSDLPAQPSNNINGH